MTSEELIRLLEDLRARPDECEWLEFKVNLSEERKIGETISAISNSALLLDRDFGYIVWGIDNIDHSVVGTDFSPRKQKIGQEELENWLASQLSPRIHFDIFEFFYEEGKKVVIFRVQPALVSPVRFQSWDWIRVGSYNKLLRDNTEKERLIWLKVVPFEKGFAARDLSAEQTLALLDYRKFFNLAQLPLPSDTSSVLERLAERRLIILSFPGCYSITNLGALSFAHRLSDFDSLAHKAVRVVRYDGGDRTAPAEQTSFDAGYAAGFEELLQSLSLILPNYVSIGIALRRSEGYPPLAVRELVANALIHQDLTIVGAGPLVEIFTTRVEISNPGAPLIETDRFIDKAPRSRNEALASLFRHLRICEELGTGIDKVIGEIERNHLPPPDFQKTDASTRVILYARLALKDMDDETKIRACYQHACLQYVSAARVMTNASLRQRFEIDARNSAAASRIIRDTLEKGLIKLKSGRVPAYIPSWA